LHPLYYSFLFPHSTIQTPYILRVASTYDHLPCPLQLQMSAPDSKAAAPAPAAAASAPAGAAAPAITASTAAATTSSAAPATDSKAADGKTWNYFAIGRSV
jgi:hypothetical protein